MLNNITYIQAAGLLLLSFVLFGLLRVLFDPLRSVPGPFAARFTRFWYFRQVSKGNSRWTELDLHRKYGPVVRLAPNQYSIDHPDVAKELYATQPNFIKSDWYKPWSSLLVEKDGFSDTFSIQDPHFHHENRKTVNNLYSMSNLMQMESCVDETITILTKSFDRFCETGAVFDVHHWMRCYALDSIVSISLNKRFGLLEHGDDEGIFKPFGDHSNFCSIAGIFPSFFCGLIKIMVKLPMKQPLQRILDFAHQQLATFEERFDEKHDINPSDLDEKSIIYRGTAFYRKDPTKFPKKALGTVAMMNVFAGTDTTAITLASVVYYLTVFPRTLEKLRAEIKETKAASNNPDKQFTYQQALKMPYLQAVIKEALRLWTPVAMTLPRVVPPGGATLAGVHFPAGTVVGINPWVASRNSNVYGSDAEEFKPERWLPDGGHPPEKLHEMDAYWLSFGQGSRICIGKNISMLEMSKVVPEIMSRYDFEFMDEAVTKNITRGITSNGGWFSQQNNLQCKATHVKTKA